MEDLTKLSDIQEESGTVLWAEADVTDVTEEDVKLVAEEFGLHPLAVEDALKARQRPKLERYENHLFMVIHQLDEVNDQLEAKQVASFVGRRYVLTIHAAADRTLEEVKKRWRESDEHDVRKGPAFLVHTLVDTLVDDYQSIADRLETGVEELEDVALASPAAPVERQLYSLKQQLARMRRYALPMERALGWVVEGEAKDFLPLQVTEYFRDVHDHTVRITEQIRNVDELTQAVLDLQRSEQAGLLNEINKKLTAWAAIIAVPTLISSIYGMNFSLLPPTDSRAGFWFALVVMAAAATSLYAFFKKRGWL